MKGVQNSTWATFFMPIEMVLETVLEMFNKKGGSTHENGNFVTCGRHCPVNASNLKMLSKSMSYKDKDQLTEITTHATLVRNIVSQQIAIPR